jgi:nucleolar MIF4G domain-containing protein 1
LYLNWLKTNSQVKSELLKAPLDVDFKTIQEGQNGQKWWLSDEDKQVYESSVKISEIEKKIDKSYLAELEAAAKAQHFATDIQKCVFYTLMNSDDYLDAFNNLQKLGLKKKQEREIIKVSFG